MDAPREDDGRAPDGRRGLVIGRRRDASRAWRRCRWPCCSGGRRSRSSRSAGRRRRRSCWRRDPARRRTAATSSTAAPPPPAGPAVAQHERVAVGGVVVARPRLPAAVGRDGRLAADLGDGLVGRGRGGGDEREREERHRAGVDAGACLLERRGATKVALGVRSPPDRPADPVGHEPALVGFAPRGREVAQRVVEHAPSPVAPPPHERTAAVHARDDMALGAAAELVELVGDGERPRRREGVVGDVDRVRARRGRARGSRRRASDGRPASRRTCRLRRAPRRRRPRRARRRAAGDAPRRRGAARRSC